MKIRSKIQSVLQSKKIMIVELGLIALVSFLFLREKYIINAPSRQEIKKLEQANQTLANQNQELEKQINYFQSPENIQKQIRDKLALGQAGEEYFIISSQTSSQNTSSSTSFWEQIISKIKDLIK